MRSIQDETQPHLLSLPVTTASHGMKKVKADFENKVCDLDLWVPIHATLPMVFFSFKHETNGWNVGYYREYDELQYFHYFFHHENHGTLMIFRDEKFGEYGIYESQDGTFKAFESQYESFKLPQNSVYNKYEHLWYIVCTLFHETGL